MRKIFLAGSILFILLMLVGCAGSGGSAVLPTATAALVPAATITPTPTLLPTATMTIIPTETPIPTATAIRTPPALPALFQTTLQNPVDPPHTYVQDTCQYLLDKWASTKSAPGTVVIPIMFHSIGAETSGSTISEEDFKLLIGALHDKGFQTVTTAQLADFLENNAKIPPRSVQLILDDRRPGTVSLYFMPYLNEYNWMLTLAWPIGAGDASTDNKPASNVLPGENFTTLWEQMEAYNATGRLDIQAHGVVHNVPMWPGVADSYIVSELQGSIDALKLHFNKAPIAIIWPGGGFSTHSVRFARQLGYKLGFTTSARGPLMFNWIPLGDRITDVHGPAWLPEGPMNDPLMVLPRYWDTDAFKHLDDILKISQDAAAYAEQNKATELEYYDIVCAPSLGPLP